MSRQLATVGTTTASVWKSWPARRIGIKPRWRAGIPANDPPTGSILPVTLIMVAIAGLLRLRKVPLDPVDTSNDVFTPWISTSVDLSTPQDRNSPSRGSECSALEAAPPRLV